VWGTYNTKTRELREQLATERKRRETPDSDGQPPAEDRNTDRALDS
jgi:hypothetical protein